MCDYEDSVELLREEACFQALEVAITDSALKTGCRAKLRVPSFVVRWIGDNLRAIHASSIDVRQPPSAGFNDCPILYWTSTK